MIKNLLQVSPHNRPTCDKIINCSAVQSKINDNIGSIIHEDSILLKTIRIPKNLTLLYDKLPKASYQDILLNNNSTDNSFSYKNLLSDISKKKFTNHTRESSLHEEKLEKSKN